MIAAGFAPGSEFLWDDHYGRVLGPHPAHLPRGVRPRLRRRRSRPGMPFCQPRHAGCDADYDYAARAAGGARRRRRVSPDRAHRQADAHPARHARRAAADPHRLRRLRPDDRRGRAAARCTATTAIEDGNHVDGRYDAYPGALRPILPCYRTRVRRPRGDDRARRRRRRRTRPCARTAGGDVANTARWRRGGPAAAGQAEAARAVTPRRARGPPHAPPLPRHRAREARARRARCASPARRNGRAAAAARRTAPPPRPRAASAGSWCASADSGPRRSACGSCASPQPSSVRGLTPFAGSPALRALRSRAPASTSPARARRRHGPARRRGRSSAPRLRFTVKR